MFKYFYFKFPQTFFKLGYFEENTNRDVPFFGKNI